jgi:two-component system, sensor histidine kinase and response regulator
VPSNIAAGFLAGLGIGLLLAAMFYRLYIKTVKRASNAMQRAETSKEQFLSNVGHEVRTPLNGILGSSALLTGSRLERDQRESVEIIKRSAEAILEVLEGVMDYLALKEGALQFVREPLDLLETVEESVDRYVATLGHQGIEVCNSFSPRVPLKVFGDRGRIRQVLSNLIGSAVGIVEEGQVLVRTKLVDRQNEASLVQIEVSCKAMGGQAKFVESSLALTLSRSMAEGMGGYVERSLQPDGWASFWLILQMAEAGSAECPIERLAGTALVFARSADLSESLRGNCELAGVKVETAPSQREMLNTLQEHETTKDPFRFLLVDTLDVDSASVELARRVGGPELTIVGATSVPEDAWRKLKDQLGLDALIAKPVRRAALQRALHTARQPLARMASSS